MNTYHEIQIGGLIRKLPLKEIKPGVRIALFNLLGDHALTEEAGQQLGKRIPRGTHALLMPDGKAQALLHVMGRFSGLPTFVARKEAKPYMAEPVLTVCVNSITTGREQCLFLGNDDVEHLRGKNVVIVDDVVSSGSTLTGMLRLLDLVGATYHGTMAVLTEGSPRTDVIALGHLPLF